MLLVGESGVGKSTWINSFANYLNFSSLKKAVEAGGLFPIDCTFAIANPQNEQVMTISSKCNDENLSQDDQVGESVTQNPQEYVFEYENTLITLIDTPGLMDTADTSDHHKDKEHISNILRLLSAYDEIHAICIFLKAGESRLSSTLKYTLTEILTHLDKGACNNVIFIFTYARSENFKSGKTLPILEKFLKENRLPIRLRTRNEPTIYCFENGTMQYIVQCINKIPETKENEKDLQESWKRSVESTKKMLQYVRSLNPHSLANIKAMYIAEHTIGVLSELVLETLMGILKDEDNLEQKRKAAEELKARIKEHPVHFAKDDLRQLLFIKRTKVEYRPLGHTNVVCKQCSVDICCEKCECSVMYFCDKMTWNPWSSECKICGCEKDKHEWRTTETVTVEEPIYCPDESVIAKIVDSDSAVGEIEEAIEKCENRIETCKNETKQMLKICAKLNTVVCKNALIKHVDVFKGGLQNIIERYKRANRNRNTGVAYLEEIQSQYETFSAKAAKKKASDNRFTVDELILQLHELPMNGKDLKIAMAEEKNAMHQAVENYRKSNTVIRRGTKSAVCVIL